jgi:hypothetical protein
MAYARFNGDWMADDFPEDIEFIWHASTYGYSIARWDDINHWDHRYGVYRFTGKGQPKKAIGVFDSPQEVVAMLKLILASEEHNDR